VAGDQVAPEVAQGQPGVDDVLHDEHVAVAQVEVEVLHDAYDPAGLGRAAVGRDGHEVELHGEIDRPGEVGHEQKRAFQHPDQERRLAVVVGGDLGAELNDARPQCRLGHDHLAEGWVRRPRHGERPYW